MEPVETLATTACRTTIAAWAKGIALDGVRGKAAIMRLGLSLFDELDVMEGNLEPRRRARPVRMPEEAVEDARAAFENEQETDVSIHPVSQGVIEEERLEMWPGYPGETPQSTIETPPNLSRPATAGRPDETHSVCESEKKILLDGEPQSARSWVARSPGPRDARPEDKSAGHDMEGVRGGAMRRPTAASAFAAGATSPLSEGIEQGAKTESERNFLAEAARNARKAPNEKEQRRIAAQAEMDRQRRAYESATAYVKAFAEKHGYEFRESQCSDRPENVPSPLSEGKSQGIINSHPEEGPNKRALRARYERLAAAQREEAERKAALAAKAVPLTPALSPRSGGEGDVSPPRDIGMNDPEPLPDCAIWMRGHRAPPGACSH